MNKCECECVSALPSSVTLPLAVWPTRSSHATHLSLSRVFEVNLFKRRVHLHLVLLWFICCHKKRAFGGLIVILQISTYICCVIWPNSHILIKVFNIKIAPIYNTFYINSVAK